MSLTAVCLLGQAMAYVSREFDAVETILSLKLRHAEAAALAAHRCWKAHERFFNDLVAHSGSLALGLPNEAASAAARSGFIDAIGVNQTVLARVSSRPWSELNLVQEALKPPITNFQMNEMIGQLMISVSHYTRADLDRRRAAWSSRRVLRLQLAQARSESLAARFTVSALEVKRRRLVRLAAAALPATPVPAETEPALQLLAESAAVRSTMEVRPHHSTQWGFHAELLRPCPAARQLYITGFTSCADPAGAGAGSKAVAVSSGGSGAERHVKRKM